MLNHKLLFTHKCFRESLNEKMLVKKRVFYYIKLKKNNKL